MITNKNIIVACNYELKPDRIGGMDRFFRAYNDHLIGLGHSVSWCFAGGVLIDFHKGLEICFPKEESLETAVLNLVQKQERVDVLVTHFMELCTPFFRSIKKKGVNYIIAVDHNPRPLKGFPIKKRIKNRLKGLFYSQYIDQLVGVSNYTRNHIFKDYGSFLKSKTCVIYNGIDTNMYIKRKEGNEGKFLVASHLRHSKGVQDLIEAVHYLPDNFRNRLRVDIYGEGPLEGFLKDKVSALALQKQFNFLGSSANLPSVIHGYSFLLQPTYMECFSLSILESLAANVPVVTTTVGGNPEIIQEGKNGFFHDPGDVKGLHQILIDILDQEKVILNNVNELIERNFPLEKMVKDHIELIPRKK